MCTVFILARAIITLNGPIQSSAGQVGPRTAVPNDAKSAASFGAALFEAESFEDWAGLYRVNVSSVFFATLGFLGLLEKSGVSASVINIGSISGVMKLAQNHVRICLMDFQVVV